MFFLDWTMILLIPAFAFTLYAQSKIKRTYAKFLAVPARAGRSGREVAEQLLNRNGISDVRVIPGEGFLGDHYDPMRKHVALSPNNFQGGSIAAVAVAAHEVGHAIQHAKGYQPLQFRHNLIPVSRIGSMLGMPLFFIGWMFGGGQLGILMDIGIALFAAAVLFQVITLPVEFDASNRAMKQLESTQILAGEELKAGRQVLNAAALTYVAAMAVSLTHLLRLLVLRDSRD